MAVILKEIRTVEQYLSNPDLSIPAFQRPYKWSVRNVIQLLDDIGRFQVTGVYRIGTIVVYKEKNDYKIVDGQQRTLTFLLMLKAVMAEKYDGLKEGQLKMDILRLYGVAFKPKFNNDITKQNVQANYREIERRMAGISEAYLKFFLKNCQVTYFVIDDISEAFQFFDSQNARGKDLEPHDLLKAFHLREINGSGEEVQEPEVARLVADWENMNTEELSALFADFIYRVRGWSNGSSSRYFGKKDIRLFKGVNLDKELRYPYVQLYRMVAGELKNNPGKTFPFQLDQTIINGKYFFDMVAHYHQLYKDFYKKMGQLDEMASTIIQKLDNYAGRNRTGDKFVRMLFNCALLFYLDKFGAQQLSEAVKKIFIWAYTLRLQYQILQLASVDNYVVDQINIFRRIKSAIHHDSIITMELPLLRYDHESPKTKEIKELFQQMKYVSVN